MRNFITEIKNKTVSKLNVQTMKTKIQIMAVCLLSLVFVVSCNKYDDDDLYPEDALQSQKMAQGDDPQIMSAVMATYAVTPSVGTFTPSSSSSVTLPGTSGCGSFYGGMIKAKVVAQSGNSFTVEIYPQVGTTFGGSGTAYIKATSVCGTVAGTATYTSVHTKATVTINATFAQGVTHFYPVIITSTGSRYYAEPFMVYTLPSYVSGPYWDGKLLATVDGIELKSSGPGNIDDDSDGVSTWQCTDFCKRYYAGVYSLSFSGWGNAKNWYNTLDTRFEKYPNNGSVAPRVGDIICFDNNPSSLTKYGHVAIITEVSATQVKLAQQNSGTTWLPIGGNVNRSGNNLTVSGYTVQGWLRKKP